MRSGGSRKSRAAALGGTPLVTRGAVDIFRHDWPLDSADAIRELDYRITPLEEGIRRTVASIANAAAQPERRGRVTDILRTRAPMDPHRVGLVRAAAARAELVAGCGAGAVSALVFNLLVLPRVGGHRLYRPVDEARGFPLGILLYPLAVLGLVLAFPSRLDIAAAGWGILALGDGAATLVGRQVTRVKFPGVLYASPRTLRFRRRLPWNREKSVAGTLAFIVFGGFGSLALELWTRPAIVPVPSLTFAIVAPLVATMTAALVESIPIRLDDNISVPFSAGVVMWLVSLMDRASIDAWAAAISSILPWAVAANAVAAWAGYRARSVSVSGAVTGFAIGVIIYAGAGGGAWVLLMITFLLASVTFAPRPRAQDAARHRRGARRTPRRRQRDRQLRRRRAGGHRSRDDSRCRHGLDRAGSGVDRRRQRHRRQ